MVKYIIIFLVLLSFQAEGQIIRANPFYTSRGAVVVATDTLLLDSFPAIVGYSLRKLRTNYTGNCIRVRRSNDNTEQDIGFVNNFLDTASMKTFVGANNGFVTTWYSQGDSARNFTQTTAGSQPRIVASGALEYTNSKLALRFVDANDNMAVPSSTSFFTFLHNVPKSAIFITVQAGIVSNPGVTYVILHSNNTVAANIGYAFFYSDISPRDNNLLHQVARGGTPTVSTLDTLNYFPANQFHLFSCLLDNANATASNRVEYQRNGSNLLNTNINTGSRSTANSTNNLTIGRSTTSLIGYMNELIIYNSDQSSNRISIENNINRNWLIY